MTSETYEYRCPRCNKPWKSKVHLYGPVHPCEPCFEKINAERAQARDDKAAKKSKVTK